MELRIALCQCDIAWEQPARNLARLEPMVAAAEADVVLLPELFATGFTLDPAGVADGAGGAVVTALRRWAARYGKAVAGSVAVAGAITTPFCAAPRGLRRGAKCGGRCCAPGPSKTSAMRPG